MGICLYRLAIEPSRFKGQGLTFVIRVEGLNDHERLYHNFLKCIFTSVKATLMGGRLT